MRRRWEDKKCNISNAFLHELATRIPRVRSLLQLLTRRKQDTVKKRRHSQHSSHNRARPSQKSDWCSCTEEEDEVGLRGEEMRKRLARLLVDDEYRRDLVVEERPCLRTPAQHPFVVLGMKKGTRRKKLTRHASHSMHDVHARAAFRDALREVALEVCRAVLVRVHLCMRESPLAFVFGTVGRYR